MKLFEELYTWTPMLLRELRQAYTLRKSEKSPALDALQRRTGWPRKAFINKAGTLGLSTSRRKWTEAEDKAIRMSASEISPDRIARDLGRSRHSVMHRAWQLGLSTKIRADYSIADVVLIFGVSVDQVNRWIDRGLMGNAEWTNTGRRVKDFALTEFIRSHTDEYSFRLSDETFIKGVLFGTGKGLSGEIAEDAPRRRKKAGTGSRGSAGRAGSPVAERRDRTESGESFACMEVETSPHTTAPA
jgi:hypothetical protein